MIDIDKILATAKNKDASDVHLICGMKPILRIMRDLVECENTEELTMEEKVVRLIKKANNRGGKDNISVAYLVKETGFKKCEGSEE